MKKIFEIGAAATAALLCSSMALAGSTSFSPNIEDFGDSDEDGSGDASAAEIFSMTFALPAILSIDSASFELAHSFLSDIHLTLTAPDGSEFIFARGRSPDNVDPFDAPFDGSDVGDGGTDLNGAEVYNFAEMGDVWNNADASDTPAAGATFESVQWITGGFAAGNWTITVIDAWDTVDDGALGTLGVNYTIPAPGAGLLLGLGGLAAIRRRR